MRVKLHDITKSFLKNIGSEEVIITYNNEDFYFKFNIKEVSSYLSVHTNGALNYKKKLPPVYQRFTWGRKIDAHCIFIDDRTLHNVTDETFDTAWLMGTENRYYVLDYSAIVKYLQAVLNIDTQKVYYWGSSAGGTSSIALATLHKGTTAIANNPQTNVLNDYPRRKEALFRNVFKDVEEQEVINKSYHRLSLVGLMLYENYVPRLFYIQNYAHKPDLNRHMNPFMEELKNSNLNINNKITYWLYNDTDRGHSPLGEDKALEYLKTIMFFKYL